MFQLKMTRCRSCFPVFVDRWPWVPFWQQGLTLWSVICSASALAEGDTHLWSADHIVSDYVLLAGREIASVCSAGSHVNNVSELVDFFYTLMSVLPAESSWLVPWEGDVNRYFRSADVWIIRFASFYATLKPYCILRNRAKKNASHVCE